MKSLPALQLSSKVAFLQTDFDCHEREERLSYVASVLSFTVVNLLHHCERVSESESFHSKQTQ